MIDEREMYNEQKARPMSELDQAIERLNKAETQIATQINMLMEKLNPIMRPESIKAQKEPGVETITHEPSFVVKRLISNAYELECHAERLAEISYRLDT
jgi:hypothetical protein